MEVPDNRKWMDNRTDPNQEVTEEFKIGVLEFVEYALEHDKDNIGGGSIRCPCKKCKCAKFQIPNMVKLHLCKMGFMSNYYHWTSHGEPSPPIPPVVVSHSYYGSRGRRELFGNYEQLVMDAAGPKIGNYLEQEGQEEGDTMLEDPNEEAERFFEMLKAAQTPLWDGCTKYSTLSASLTLLSLKAEYGFSQGCFNALAQFIGNALPDSNTMPKNYYRAKKSIEELGLGCSKIECCPNGCMLYYKEDEVLQSCKICGEERYTHVRRRGKDELVPRKHMWYFPLVPRLQRLYSSIQTAREMRWHREKPMVNGSLSHPSDAEAWKHFDEAWPSFAEEPRNVRLGLCSDGFAPFDKTGRRYSSWPVIITPYNLPPWMCMRREFMFLTILIPGPSDPTRRIDVYLRPLIDELKMLWEDGVVTYDVSLKQNFLMKAAVMWTINDFPAYGMLSGWMTMGKRACPICMERSKAFTLDTSKKTSWFDCHRQFLPQDHPFRRNKTAFTKDTVETSTPPRRLSGEEVWEIVKDLPSVEESVEHYPSDYRVKHNWTKRSIFWELPYWKTHLLRHNLDVMHIERNVFLNILFTVMDTKGKTKDTYKSRKDLEAHCKRKGLELQPGKNGNIVKPKAPYTLTKQQRIAVCEWVKNLRLPDGYASNLSRCVDLKEAKLSGMKSHDCHVFLQRLIPLAFKALPKPILNTLTEFSNFFREITSSLLMEDKLRVLEQNIPIIMCKLEQIFPPSFFDSMEHLPIHLAYEARVGGPVQYRWMYPFERSEYTISSLIFLFLFIFLSLILIWSIGSYGL